MQIFDWNNLSSKNKEELNINKPIFICGSRKMSENRISHIFKNFSLQTSKKILWGVLKDTYVPGLEHSPQFKTLSRNLLQRALNKQKNRANIDLLAYFQRDQKYIFKELKFSAAIFVNGSWHRMLHLREDFWVLVNKKVPYKLISPFLNKEEAKRYVKSQRSRVKGLTGINKTKYYKLPEIMKTLKNISLRSYDHCWQTGTILAKNCHPKHNEVPSPNNLNFSNEKNVFKILLTGHNKIVPYETYAMHHGSLKEKTFSPPNDLNNYDSIHAEVDIILKAQRKKLNLKNTSIFINLLPCPTCAKMIAKSQIKNIYYQHDHSNGYAFNLLKKIGKNVIRLSPI